MRTLVHIFIALAACAASPTQAQEVYRCDNTYSHEPCKGAKVVETTPPVSDPQGAKTKLIFLCKRPDTTQPWWIHEECSRRGWTLIESVRVPSNIHWDDQVVIAERKRASNRAQQTFTPNYSNSASNSENSFECENLNKRVAELDSMGRAGGTVRRMEWIRQERQRTRDRQFQIGC